jgi:hypothetical protein
VQLLRSHCRRGAHDAFGDDAMTADPAPELRSKASASELPSQRYICNPSNLHGSAGALLSAIYRAPAGWVSRRVDEFLHLPDCSCLDRPSGAGAHWALSKSGGHAQRHRAPRFRIRPRGEARRACRAFPFIVPGPRTGRLLSTVSASACRLAPRSCIRVQPARLGATAYLSPGLVSSVWIPRSEVPRGCRVARGRVGGM